MNKILVSLLSKFIPEKTAYAHCDIPCGIYDPHNAQLAAHTIIRMTELLTEVKRDSETKAEHDIARLTHVKEDQASLLEEELTTLENDYFKPEHYKEHPKLGEHFSNANKFGAKARQNIDMRAAEELLEEVMQIAEIFFKQKC
jgi:nickel superoxide dismutase